MQIVNLIARGDLLSSKQLFQGPVSVKDLDIQTSASAWTSKTNISIVGRERAKQMERLTFMIDHFDESMDYYVDLGDGNSRRVLGRKFHYQYGQSGQFTLKLYTKAGETMIPICVHQVSIEQFSIFDAIRNLNFF